MSASWIKKGNTCPDDRKTRHHDIKDLSLYAVVESHINQSRYCSKWFSMSMVFAMLTS